MVYGINTKVYYYVNDYFICLFLVLSFIIIFKCNFKDISLNYEYL